MSLFLVSSFINYTCRAFIGESKYDLTLNKLIQNVFSAIFITIRRTEQHTKNRGKSNHGNSTFPAWQPRWPLNSKKNLQTKKFFNIGPVVIKIRRPM